MIFLTQLVAVHHMPLLLEKVDRVEEVEEMIAPTLELVVMAEPHPHLVLLVRVVVEEETHQVLVLLLMVDLVVVLVDLVLLIVQVLIQVTQQDQELQSVILADQKVIPIQTLDTTVVVAVVPVVLAQQVVHGQALKVVVVLDMRHPIYLMLAIMELDLLGQDGLLVILHRQDSLVVDLLVHIIKTWSQKVAAEEAVVVHLLLKQPMISIIQALQWQLKAILVETTLDAAVVVEKDKVVVEDTVVMELSSLHMMHHQHLSAQIEPVPLNF
tara:strand:- start:974 stop:1780 length:807 start_codon:yes stop_codon:yes gene_type:complete